MFSILIPTYNYNCTTLVEQLAHQAQQLFSAPNEPLPYEIIVGDDGSTDKNTIEANRKIASLPHCCFVERGCNVGRAAIRNWLAQKAIHPYLIFIDSDASVESPDYLIKYYHACQHHKVICGGIQSTNNLPSAQHSLRFYYEKKADLRRSAAHRSTIPYEHFTTFNFCIARELFLKIKFSEENKDYGHEDTYFGVCLKNKKEPIIHIDNHLIHNGIDTNIEFIEKTETALLNLSKMHTCLKEEATVSRIATKLKRMHILPWMCAFHQIFCKLEKRNLTGSNPSLFVFSLYKLGYYCCLLKGR